MKEANLLVAIPMGLVRNRGTKVHATAKLYVTPRDRYYDVDKKRYVVPYIIKMKVITENGEELLHMAESRQLRTLYSDDTSPTVENVSLEDWSSVLAEYNWFLFFDTFIQRLDFLRSAVDFLKLRERL